MRQKPEDKKRLESNVANILLNYKATRIFRVEEIVGKLKQIGFPYANKTHYRWANNMIQEYLDLGLISLCPEKKTSKRIAYVIADIDKLHEHIKPIINSAHINSEITYVEPEYVNPPVDTPPETPDESSVEDEGPEPRDNYCMFEILEYIAECPKYEFSVNLVFSFLFNEGFDITLREVRKNIASLAKEFIVKVIDNKRDVYTVNMVEKFYKKLDLMRREAYKLKPSIDPNVALQMESDVVGAYFVDYANHLRDNLEKTQKKLDDVILEIELYKEENSKLRKMIKEQEEEV